ncbi:hypothetical protein MHL40_02505 [Pseudomonas luteola]|uniref:hypothetical protein n=1 Tax=Pseudomonas luteola TaxID=47886 RepID=UPI001EF517BC|nr:hypothetical protein [Pseudomonas luteola]MCG7371545.1 hypothetical protein [Pseudomonas luteola]
MATPRKHPNHRLKAAQTLMLGLAFLGASFSSITVHAAEVSFREAGPEQTWHVQTDNVLVRKWPVVYDTAAARRGNVQTRLAAGTSVRVVDTREYKRWKKIQISTDDQQPVEGWIESKDVHSAIRVE